jgi:hypothetical protein
MSKKDKQQRAESAIDAAKQDSGLGNLSAEDLAAIRGGDAPEASGMDGDAASSLTSGAPAGAEAPMDKPVTATEALLRADETGPESLNLEMIKRMLTLESEVDALKKIIQAWATEQRRSVALPQRPGATVVPPVTVPATPEEEAAYCRTNLALLQDGQKPYDGLQSWRDAGGPKLEPREEEKRGRAA